MKQTFAEFLNSVKADTDMIHQAFRMHLSEQIDDLNSDEMLDELEEHVNDKIALADQLKQLQSDPSLIEQVALLYFEQAWEGDGNQENIKTVFEEARKRLPIIETALLAIAAMYGMYLLATDGVTKIKIKKNADGSFETLEERAPFAPLISAIAKLLGGGKG